MVCADNTVVISMRACDREKSETLVHAALKEFPAGIGLWYMGKATRYNVWRMWLVMSARNLSISYRSRTPERSLARSTIDPNPLVETERGL